MLGILHLFCKFYNEVDRVNDSPQASDEQREKAEIGTGDNDFCILMSGLSNRWGCIHSFAMTTLQKDSVFSIKFIFSWRRKNGIFHWKNLAFPQWKCFSWTVFCFLSGIFLRQWQFGYCMSSFPCMECISWSNASCNIARSASNLFQKGRQLFIVG